MPQETASQVLTPAPAAPASAALPSTGAFRSTALEGPVTDGAWHAGFLRRLWKRSGRGGRRLLVRWAKLWLSWRAPVVVPVVSGQIVLNGPGFCARAVLLTGGYEREDEARFQALLAPGMTVFDIGANLGIYTLLAAGPVGASGTVHAFEPVPDLLSYLEESVRRSGAGNVVVNPLAVGDCSEPVPMYLALKKKHSGWHSLAPSADRPRQIQVQGITLDDYVEARGLDRVDLIKIDIEGGELPAFRGASRLLSRPDAPILQAELCDSHCAHFGYTSRDAKEYLAALGYAGYRAGGDGKWRTVSPDESHRKAENVFFLKPGQLSRAPEEWGLPQPAGDL